MDRYSIAIDTLGGDNGSRYMVMGIADAMKQANDFDVILTGHEDELKTYINELLYMHKVGLALG